MKNCENTESFCRSTLAIYTNDWSTFDMFTASIFFSGKFLNACRPRTEYPLWQSGPPGLAFYGSVLACLPSWLGMVNGLFQKKKQRGVEDMEFPGVSKK